MNCKVCGSAVDNDMRFCSVCGAEQDQAPAQVAPAYEAPAYETPADIVPEGAEVQEKKPFPVLGLISMICGIVGILCCCCYGLGIIPGIAAIILAIVDRAKAKKFSGFSITGLITGIVAFLLAISYWILAAIGVAGESAALGGFGSYDSNDYYSDYYDYDYDDYYSDYYYDYY